MRFLPHTPEEIEQMLQAVQLERLEQLFDTIPAECRRQAPMELPAPLSEWALNARMDELADRNRGARLPLVFLGAGSYHHHIPEAVLKLSGRAEFVTAYTPYQAEISQGTLQGIYEFQTLVARLLDMEVANASMYDGASALAEALLMAIRVTRRKKVAISAAIHPHYRQVVRTYFRPTTYELIELPYGPDGGTDLGKLPDLAEMAAVALQSPNFFGCIESLAQWSDVIHQDPKTLLVTTFTEPLAYGLLQPPGACGADIVCGEGQSLGLPRSFGGPYLGLFATRMRHLRSMPGRLVGKTQDGQGRRGFVLTLSTREQHIRREKATSNICSNQGLCAMTAAIYMASLGSTGIGELARLNYDKSEYLKSALGAAGATLVFSRPTFNEFVVRPTGGFDARYRRMVEKGVVAGLPLSEYYPEMADCTLLCATETAAKEDMDRLVEELAS